MQQFYEENRNLKVYVNGEIFHRNNAKISVFDSVVQGGDAVWEGLRVYDGKIFMLDRHLNRLMESAHTMDFKEIPTEEFIIDAIMKTLEANNMRDNTHIRLTLTRGEKITSGMDPRLNQSGCGLIVLAEYKPPVYDRKIEAITSSIRRNSPMCIDSKIHHNNLINNILAKIEANLLNLDAAIMLDIYGYVSEANGTNLFMIKNDEVHTPTADSCLPGITRGIVIELCKENHIPIVERNISMAEMYNADIVFMTGTMGEITLITKIDGRAIINRNNSQVYLKLKTYFEELTKIKGKPLAF